MTASYELRIGEKVVAVTADPPEGEGPFCVHLGKRQAEVLARRLGEGRWHLVVDGKALEVFVVRTQGGKHIFVDGRTYLVEDARTTERGRQKRALGGETGAQVTPPMPSVVVRILVEEGDMVRKGQGLVVVSAMKMETTLVAPRDGKVTRINTQLEAKVAPGDILVSVEEEEAAAHGG